MVIKIPSREALEVPILWGHPNFQTFICILGPKVLDFKGIFGATMR